MNWWIIIIAVLVLAYLFRVIYLSAYKRGYAEGNEWGFQKSQMILRDIIKQINEVQKNQKP